MSNCPICNRSIRSEKPFNLMFSEKRHENIYCCECCEKKYTTIMLSEKPGEVKDGINYFYAHIKGIKDEELRDFLQEMIEDNADSVEEIEAEQAYQKQQRSNDYFQKRNASKQQAAEEQSFGWISFLQIINWLAFIGLAVLGLLLALPFFDYNASLAWAILIGCIIAGLIILAVGMVLLGIAEDIRHIRNKLGR